MSIAIYNESTMFAGKFQITNAMHGEARGYWVEDVSNDDGEAIKMVMDDFGNLVWPQRRLHRTGRACFYWGDQPNMPVWFKPDWKFL